MWKMFYFMSYLHDFYCIQFSCREKLKSSICAVDFFNYLENQENQCGQFLHYMCTKEYWMNDNHAYIIVLGNNSREFEVKILQIAFLKIKVFDKRQPAICYNRYSALSEAYRFYPQLFHARNLLKSKRSFSKSL